MNCTFVHGKIINQIRVWSGDDCSSGEKCRYKVSLGEGIYGKA